MSRILIIEDDLSIAEIERDYLKLSNYEVDIETDGKSGLLAGLGGGYDLILLDLMLPGMDGFSICEKLRSSLDIPILIVSARLENPDKIKGLGLGADDYIEKPFAPSVLVARVKANLSQYRRLKSGGDNSERTDIVKAGDITVNIGTREVTRGGRPIELKNKEFELLLFLMQHENLVFDRETLYEKVWGIDAYGDNATVAVHINRLREKLEDDPADPKMIQTIRGAGYRFRATTA